MDETGGDLERMDGGGLTYYRNPAWPELRHGVFTRRGGVSRGQWRSLNLGASNGDEPAAVRENHRLVFRSLDLPGTKALSSWLVHGTEVLVVSQATPRARSLARADGIITDLPDTPLVMRYADCAPLLLYDRRQGAIGLGHAGWRGAVAGMAAKLVRAMSANFGCEPADIEALIGPAISGRNYPVGDEVVVRAEAYFGAEAGVIARENGDGAPRFDLPRANALDLWRSGVTEVSRLDICTFENTDEFFSHRAENGATGRFGVVMSL